MKELCFHIEWIIDLIKEQEPDRFDLIDQLNKFERKMWIRQPYVSLIEGNPLNFPAPEWQLDENVTLEHKTEGTIVLEILKDGRIGGIEFINQIPRA